MGHGFGPSFPSSSQKTACHCSEEARACHRSEEGVISRAFLAACREEEDCPPDDPAFFFFFFFLAFKSVLKVEHL